MTQTSSVVTGGVTVTAATLVPLVNWALQGFPHPIPDSVPYLIAAGLVTLGHLTYNVVKAKGLADTVKVADAQAANAAMSAVMASAASSASVHAIAAATQP